MKTRRLMAIKPHKYGTRHLTAGEEYDAPDRQAVALVAARRARFADKQVPRAAKPAAKPAAPPLPPASPAPSEPQSVGAMMTETGSLDRLRRQAIGLGIEVDGRWGAARLQQEIAQARQR